MRADERSRDTVLFVCSMGYLGGSVQSLATVLRELTPGIRAVLATPDNLPLARAATRDELADDVLSLRAGHRPHDAMSTATRLAAWTVRNRQRLLAVHANGLNDAVTSLLASAVGGVPLVVWVHDADVTTRRVAPLAPVLRRSRRIRWVAVSQATRGELVQSGYAAPAAVTVIGNPIDPATALTERSPRSGPIHIGFLASPTSRKGYDLLPLIARRLDPARARLLVFARRPQPGAEPDVRRAAEELATLESTGVELLDKCADVREAFARCDIVLCPSREESFCRVAAEAMLNGIPVVASDIPALREVTRSEAGLLFAVGDADAALAALRRLIDDPALRASLGAAGRQHAASFAPAIVTRALESLYRGERACTAP